MGDNVDSLGYYIMIALLGAGAAYGLSHKGKPKPALTTTKKKVVIVCCCVVIACLLLLVTVASLPHTSASH